MFYFGYGSNMSPAQMTERCGIWEFVSVASLAGYRLAFVRYSTAWGGGTCGLVKDDTKVVWGVVYDLSEEAIAKLDAWEGAPRSHYREPALVKLASDEEPVYAETYFVTRFSATENLPTKRYMDRILEGARHWGLPADYIRFLDAIPTREMVR